MLTAGVQGGAQQPATVTPHAAVKFGFEEVSGWLAAAAAAVPAEKYTYKPVGTVRSFGELMAHAADGMNWFCGSAKAAKDVQWSDAVGKGRDRQGQGGGRVEDGDRRLRRSLRLTLVNRLLLKGF